MTTSVKVLLLTAICCRTVRRNFRADIAVEIAVALSQSLASLTFALPIHRGARTHSVRHRVSHWGVLASSIWSMVLVSECFSELVFLRALVLLLVSLKIVSSRLFSIDVGSLEISLHHSVVIVVEHVAHLGGVSVLVVEVFIIWKVDV